MGDRCFSGNGLKPSTSHDQNLDNQSTVVGNEFSTVLQKLLEKHTEVEQLKQENIQIKNALEKKQAVVKLLFKTIDKQRANINDFEEKVSNLEYDVFQLSLTACRKLNYAMANGVIHYERLKERILTLEKLEYYKGQWFADGVEFSFEHAKDFVVWVTNSFSANQLEWKLPKWIVFKNLEYLSLINSTICSQDYVKMVCDNTIKYLYLEDTTVYDDKIIPFDDIFNGEAPNVVKFSYTFKHGEIVPEISQKLANNRPFPNLRSVELKEIQEPFDLKKNSSISYCYLEFYGSDELYSQITRDGNELTPTLPQTKFTQSFANKTENDILSIIKAIADEALSNSESNGVEQSKKRKLSTMNGQSDDNFNKSKAENEKLKKIIENQNETIKKQALIISQLIEKSKSIVAVTDDGEDQKAEVISAIGDEMKSENGERNNVLPQNHGSAVGADTSNEAEITEKTLERITEATSWMQSEIIYLEQLYKNESKEKQRWKTMALNLLNEAKALKEENKETVNSIIYTLFNNQEQQPQLPTAVQQPNNFNVVTLDEIYDGFVLNCARLTSQTLLNVNKIAAAEKGCWNMCFNVNPLEYLNIAIGKLFKKSGFKLQLSEHNEVLEIDEILKELPNVKNFE
uniref:Uncharacterized protein n=1 Tax=Panagrolaimus davidi TaxID=227884 RepID=A0A914Q8X8_9BILA